MNECDNQLLKLFFFKVQTMSVYAPISIWNTEWKNYLQFLFIITLIMIPCSECSSRSLLGVTLNGSTTLPEGNSRQAPCIDGVDTILLIGGIIIIFI